MMKSWFGTFSASPHEEPVETTVLATDNDISIGYRLPDGSVHTIKWPMRDVQVSFDRSSDSTRIIYTAEPARKLLVQGKEALTYVEQEQMEMRKPWHARKKGRERLVALSVIFGIIAVLVTSYLLAVPWLAGKLAATIPAEREAQFGDAVYDALGLSSAEKKEATVFVNEFFDAMNVTSDYMIRIKVVEGDIVNAFALPGGIIVVYTGLLKRLESYPELAALLGHEFTHVDHKHSTKSIARKLGSRIFLGLLFGNFGSVTSVLVNQADEFKSLNYSRSLEKEADMNGLAILMERKIDPAGFASLFTTLKKASTGRAVPEFLASHPDIDKRIEYIHAAAEKAVVTNDGNLQSIFEKIKVIK